VGPSIRKKVGNHFAHKRRSLGRYSLLTDSHWSFSFRGSFTFPYVWGFFMHWVGSLMVGNSHVFRRDSGLQQKLGSEPLQQHESLSTADVASKLFQTHRKTLVNCTGNSSPHEATVRSFHSLYKWRVYLNAVPMYPPPPVTYWNIPKWQSAINSPYVRRSLIKLHSLLEAINYKPNSKNTSEWTMHFDMCSNGVAVFKT
jgi:hypothetical protein